jgi:hypothetical protein
LSPRLDGGAPGTATVGAKTRHAVAAARSDRKNNAWKFNPSNALWLIFSFLTKKRDDYRAACFIEASQLTIHPSIQ